MNGLMIAYVRHTCLPPRRREGQGFAQQRAVAVRRGGAGWGGEEREPEGRGAGGRPGEPRRGEGRASGTDS